MIHDPLCPNKSEHYDGSILWPARCDCALIIKVRADERSKRIAEDKWVSAREAREYADDIRAYEREAAAQRLLEWFHRRRIDVVSEALAAVREEEEGDLSPEAGGLHGDIPDTPESRSFFDQLLVDRENELLVMRQNPDNHFLFCPLSFSCGHRDRYSHHLCVPGGIWCVDCDRNCACMKEI